VLCLKHSARAPLAKYYEAPGPKRIAPDGGSFQHSLVLGDLLILHPRALHQLRPGPQTFRDCRDCTSGKDLPLTSLPAGAGAPLDVDSLRALRLPRSWFARDALRVGRALIGCLLVHEGPGGAVLRVSRIVETESYRGPRDLACHARAGLTKRTRSLLGEEGHAYVFFIYGMHECFNVTCRGAGSGHAVLIRAGEPVAGLDRSTCLGGPGRFTHAMGISRALDGHDLTQPPLYICARAKRPRIAVTPRVGVGYAGKWADCPWRFFDASSPCVSKPPKSAIGLGPDTSRRSP
jgi:DNA-3-methyladenine glycosylase